MKSGFSFQSEHMELRAFEPEDVAALHAYLNYPDLIGRRYIPWKFPGTLPLSKGQVEAIYQAWIKEEKAFNMAVVLREGGDLIGHAHCSWEWDPHCPGVSVVIAPAHQQQGFGSQVLALLLDYLFEMTPAHSVSGGMVSWNQPALQFALKNGFAQSGAFRRVGIRDGEYFDWVGMDLLRPEWQERKGE
jgi:RimJ/RimL family protein N-acetyltransferase